MDTFFREGSDERDLQDNLRVENTEGLYKFLNISDTVVNKKFNKTIQNILKKDPFSMFLKDQEIGHSFLNQISKYYNNITPQLFQEYEYNRILPTCAQFDDEGKLICLFRQTESKFVSGGDSDPFNRKAFIVGPKGMLGINIDKYDSETTFKSTRVTYEGKSKYFSGLGGENYVSQIQQFESNPSMDNSDLITVYYSLVTDMRGHISRDL